MAIPKKYKAKYVWWHDQKKTIIHPLDVEIYRCNGKLKTPDSYIRFDSQHEFHVYLELVRLYGYSRIIRQHKIQVVPNSSCYPNGKTWRVDFAISNGEKQPEIVQLYEAKGVVTREFTYTLSLLEAADKKLFEQLKIVFPRKIPLANHVIKAVSETSPNNNLITLKELKNTKH